MTSDTKLLVAVGIAGAAALLLMRAKLPSVSDLVPSSDTVRTTIGNLGDYAGQATAGAIEGIGLAIGIPRTNMTECERAKAEGRWWDASFACPAGDFISSGASAAYQGVFGSTNVNAATQADVRRVDNALSLLPGQGYTDSSGRYIPWGAVP